MSATAVIRIDMDAVDRRLQDGELWVAGWGTPDDPDAPTCLHGAIRYCQAPGDAVIIRRVADRYGFGMDDNDDANSWEEIRSKVIPDITDDMLEATFGPQWEPIVSLIRRVAVITPDEAASLPVVPFAAFELNMFRGSMRDSGRFEALWSAELTTWWAVHITTAKAASSPLSYAASGAAMALAVRDLIGKDGFEQEHYDELVAPWAAVFGKVHPDDKDMTVTDKNMILELLNGYNGDNIWQDVIWPRIDIDVEKTEWCDPDYLSDRFVAFPGLGFRYVLGLWVSWDYSEGYSEDYSEDYSEGRN